MTSPPSEYLPHSYSNRMLYSPQEMIVDPNVMLSDGYDYSKTDRYFQSGGDSLWSRDDSFHSEPQSASHDPMDMDLMFQDSLHHDPLRDPLLYHNHPDPLHDPMQDLSHLAPFETEIHKEPSRDYLEPAEMLQTLDPNPQDPDRYFQPRFDPLEMECEEESSSSSQGRETPATTATTTTTSSTAPSYM